MLTSACSWTLIRAPRPNRAEIGSTSRHAPRFEDGVQVSQSSFERVVLGALGFAAGAFVVGDVAVVGAELGDDAFPVLLVGVGAVEVDDGAAGVPFLVLLPFYWTDVMPGMTLMAAGHVLMLPAMLIAMLRRRHEDSC